MSFSEQLKLRVKRRSAFMCCRCRAIGIEVHHILPEAEGGPDTEDNAAPLCPNCHTWFGDNPIKRKEIGQMRDWWYEVCETNYGGEDKTAKRLDELLAEIRDQSAREEQRQAALDEIRQVLQRLNAENQPDDTDTPAEVSEKVDRIVTATRLGDRVYANVQCKRCNSYTGLLVGSNTCPTCGEPL